MVELPKGYKETEVGVIPDDWRVSVLENVAKIIDPQPDHRTPPAVAGGEPYIGISNFKADNSVDWDGSRKIIAAAVDKQQGSFQLGAGDIIFGKIGTIGLPKFLPITTFRYALSANILLIQPNIEPHFLMAWLKSSQLQASIKRELHSTSQAAFGIHKMRALLIPLPPTVVEQKAIGKALSDTDALIAALEKMITKKRAIKTATMQQLLTGKTRLPGFGEGKGYKDSELGRIPEDWEVSSVGSAFVVVNNHRIPLSREQRKYMAGPFRYYGPTGVLDYINEYRYDGRYALIGEDGDHFLKWVNSPMTLLVEGRFNVNNHAHVIAGGENQVEWFAYFFKNRDILNSLTRQGAGRYKLTKASLVELPCLIPPPQEQSAISKIIHDLDSEITNVGKLREKNRSIKSAMMQQLLTGRTRLI